MKSNSRFTKILIFFTLLLFSCNASVSTMSLKINSFSVTENKTSTEDGLFTLSWDVSGATSLWIDQEIGNVTGLKSIKISRNETKIYSLIASNTSGVFTILSAKVEKRNDLNPGYIRIANISGQSGSNIAEMKMDSEIIYPGGQTELEDSGYEYTKYLEIPFGKHEFSLIFDSRYSNDAPIGLNGIYVAPGKKYTIYLHTNDKDEKTSATVIQDFERREEKVKYRFINLYRKVVSGDSIAKLYKFNENERCDEKDLINSQKLDYEKSSAYFDIAPGIYYALFESILEENSHFSYRSNNCRQVELTNFGNYSIVIGSYHSNGGSTVIAVAD
jgi:hypothetical protein